MPSVSLKTSLIFFLFVVAAVVIGNVLSEKINNALNKG